ncbi:D-alanyl-D-alanine carboxypeptidase/D-alanyl-D-alanine-endopeptidase [Xylella taiwanensis]|uniref:D-alanyl-D-alanine carboxypeptidase/D-alanyl-D-alanine-endopeptidase n=1 Tax=Xylella taiwanensis TaxID=1444770 RepID=A0ABS8TVC9_9GAMM|nr:D-alanyl-D-alanine carboxypeptidase/D-alanyl-D-alanine-endopeptidase [Xylella taiwanensis]MCD8455514.1 D-alanyl-D-alanine carboxypeptidase/D-alanyl-D-alanine-endopeptidase [Xylella taiwanensis]MCD8457921.1 D-alanyl-D-alanine carboxypeptidase/D-alanyl-D-alanine-endopeptidase [Xylella taiwanensis]MCD8460056.1 D-alanyl-D-alanine carboxypeptidase/D-alanyl-D-alanine-endopeptidase [Xylella taiwanensis]MCD8463885.1 D-alanyl-D-alanine carboxypeptidase/D-alanyl-D-alanine-endopeptidase [Xylella taiwan
MLLLNEISYFTLLIKKGIWIPIVFAFVGCSTFGSTKDQPSKRSDASSISRSALASRIDKIIASNKSTEGSLVALTVRDAKTGDVLYALNTENRLSPASNLKLVTLYSAFSVLGGDYRFETSLMTDGIQREGHLAGNLYLKGTGDPTLSADDYDSLASDLAARGISKIDDNLVLDDTWFDSIALGSGWMIDDEDKYFAAQIAALTFSPNADFDAGSVIIDVSAVETGNSAPRITVSPRNNVVKVISRVVNGNTSAVTISRARGSNDIYVSGTVKPGDSIQELRSVWRPSLIVSDIFQIALKRHGIEVAGHAVVGQAAPEQVSILVKHQSASLESLAIPLMKLSNNTMAEIFLKSIGRKSLNQGSASAGVQATLGVLAADGINSESLIQVDGSGLSRYNLVTSRILTDILLAARKKPWFAALYASLPVAGQPDRLIGGTLRNRMRGTVAESKVIAKTGSMTGISSLSGYVTAVDNYPLVFSILLNNLIKPANQTEDSIAETLASCRCASGETH